jgi:hypothetical protein
LLRGHAFPGDLAVFLDLAGPQGRRDENHELAFVPPPVQAELTL